MSKIIYAIPAILISIFVASYYRFRYINEKALQEAYDRADALAHSSKDDGLPFYYQGLTLFNEKWRITTQATTDHDPSMSAYLKLCGKKLRSLVR